MLVGLRPTAPWVISRCWPGGRAPRNPHAPASGLRRRSRPSPAPGGLALPNPYVAASGARGRFRPSPAPGGLALPNHRVAASGAGGRPGLRRLSPAASRSRTTGSQDPARVEGPAFAGSLWRARVPEYPRRSTRPAPKVPVFTDSSAAARSQTPTLQNRARGRSRPSAAPQRARSRTPASQRPARVESSGFTGSPLRSQ
jgi:hypothetical protein